jgi:hypothetical protein
MPSPRQFKSRIDAWGFKKNIKSHEKEAMIRKEIERKTVDGKETAFTWRGIPVEKAKIDRHKSKRKPDAVEDVSDLALGKNLLYKC